jgi:glycine/D-amino acid oxidase-like deaminating enzyme
MDAGKSVLMIDPSIGVTALAPAALVNPAMGRYAKLSWEAEQCYEAIFNRASELTSFTGINDLFADTGVIRPAINTDLAENFHGSLDAHDWPDGWISWIDAEDAASRVSVMAPQHGALLLNKGFTVYVDRYVTAYRSYLEHKGAKLVTDALKHERLTSHNAIGDARFKIGEFLAENIIVAAGSGTLDFPEFAGVPLHRVKGQIAAFEADHDLEWDTAISAMGYILRDGKRGIIAGSTYEHNQNNFDLTEQAYRQILHKLFSILPGLSGKVVKTGQHAGIRVTTPNKLPAIGSPNDHPGLYIYTALGSKGLLFSEHVAGILAANMLDGTPLPPDLDVNRFL